MLNWLICYLNSQGYYFYDPPQSNFVHYRREYCNNYNNQYSYSVPPRRRKMIGAQKNVASNDKNKRNQAETGKRTALEDRKALGATETPKTASKKFTSSQTTVDKDKKIESLQIDDKKCEILKKEKKANTTPKVVEKIVLPPIQQAQQRNKGPKPVAKAALSNPIGSANRVKSKPNNKFSVRDPCTPGFISAIGSAFSSEIELLQMHLLSERCRNPVCTDNDMIIANICIENNLNIADHIFEFIRSELVGWIGVYQQEGMDTPIFHSITNKSTFITIICDNKYAFECVERCVEDIKQMKTIKSLKILPLPHITPIIYCVDAKYEGIASDTDLFLLQLHLHKPKLYSDNWVVASHEVCPEECKTYFIFLIDERSALALNFLYSQSFCVCMQSVTFRNRGVVKGSI